MKTKILIGLTIIAITLILVSVMYTSATADDMTIAPTWTPPPPDPESYPAPVPVPYPAPEQELIMKLEQWVEIDGVIQIFSVPIECLVLCGQP